MHFNVSELQSGTRQDSLMTDHFKITDRKGEECCRVVVPWETPQEDTKAKAQTIADALNAFEAAR